MLRAVVFAVFLAGLVSQSQEHAIGNGTCDLRFQEYIKAAIAVKRECKSVTFHDCCQPKTLFSKVNTGTYEIPKPCRIPFELQQHSYVSARCDMDRGNGGWLVIQRRVAGGTEDFYRVWNDYEEGFGDLEGEFWYGLKNIHCLTDRESMELRFDLEDEEGNKVTRTYQEFRVEGPENKYRLHIGGGDTPAGANDFMAGLNNIYFSTKDRDNDIWSGHCARDLHKGAWWYSNCAQSNPNGAHDSTARMGYRIYARPESPAGSGSIYYPNYEIKIRPKSCVIVQSCD